MTDTKKLVEDITTDYDEDGAKCGAKLPNTACTVVRKATEAQTTRKVLRNSLLDYAILTI